MDWWRSIGTSGDSERGRGGVGMWIGIGLLALGEVGFLDPGQSVETASLQHWADHTAFVTRPRKVCVAID